MKDVKNRFYRFENVEIDVQNIRLTVDSKIRPLEPKSFRLLLFLVENPGQVLPKDEIISAVWPDTAVSDNSLTRAVTQVRKALDDDSKAPRYIETVPTVGYRFLRDCKAEHDPAGASVAPDGRPAHVLESVSATTQARVWPYRWAAIAGTAAAAIGLAIGGWLFYGRKGHLLTEQDTIVLADFKNTTGDNVFDDTLKQGLAVQLGQSPLLNILPDQKVRSTLQEMTHSSDEPLTATLAQEVCERTGSKAYLVGSITNLGGHYILGLNTFNCATGDALAREQTEAGDKQQVLAALGNVALKLRKQLGESLKSIQSLDVPLAQATTSSLEALKAYSLGLTKFANGDFSSAIQLFQQAIDSDPQFAMAYANLGRAYENVDQYNPMDQALRKAFDLRNRTTEREKLDISAGYYQFVTHQTEEAIQTCELWRQKYPRDFTPHRILGFEYAVLGKWENSAEAFRAAKDLDPSQFHPYAGLMQANMALNRLPEALAVYEEARSRKLDDARLLGYRYSLAFLQNDKETMKQTPSELASRPGFELTALSEQIDAAVYYGHLAEARGLSRRMMDIVSREKDKGAMIGIEEGAAYREVLFGNVAEGRRRVEASLKMGGEGSALPLALLGETAQATKLIQQMATRAAPQGFINGITRPEIEAAVELKSGNPMRAVELLAPVTIYEAGWEDSYMAAYLRGESFLAAHHGQDAALEFQKILDHPGVVFSNPIGPLARLGVARAHAMSGDMPRARAAYESFLALWKDADADIPVLIAAKSEYAKLN